MNRRFLPLLLFATLPPLRAADGRLVLECGDLALQFGDPKNGISVPARRR